MGAQELIYVGPVNIASVAFVTAIVVPIVGYVLKGWLEQTFVRRDVVYAPDGESRLATVKDLNGLGGKQQALESLMIQIRESSDASNDRVSLLEQAQHHDRERMAELVVKPMERMIQRLDVLGEQAIRLATLVEQVARQVDRIEKEKR
jgi:hypothetical protein